MAHHLRPEKARRARWMLLVVVPLIVLAVVIHSVLLAPVIGIVILLIAAWVLRAQR